jgi:hypothetical protein
LEDRLLGEAQRKRRHRCLENQAKLFETDGPPEQHRGDSRRFERERAAVTSVAAS